MSKRQQRDIKEYSKDGINVVVKCPSPVSVKCDQRKILRVKPVGFGDFDILDIQMMEPNKCSGCGGVFRLEKIVFKNCVYSYTGTTHPEFEQIESKDIKVEDHGFLPRSDRKFAKLSFKVRRILKKNEIDAGDIERGKLIAVGSFGKVYEGAWNGKGGGLDVVLKIIKIDPHMSMISKMRILSEFEIIMDLNYPLVVRCYGYSFTKGEICIVMEKYKGNLFELVIGIPKLTIYEKFKLLRKVTQAIHYLHCEKVVHRDIKSFNFLHRNQGKEIAVTDFGLATVMTNSMTHINSNLKGTARWIAPELVSANPKYSTSSDIYALGITFWELLYEKIPYSNYKRHDQFLLEDVKEKNLRPCVADPNLPSSMRKLLVRMWDRDKKRRPSTTKILQWFKKLEPMYEKRDKVVKLKLKK